MMYGSAEIDGCAFCLGLQLLKLPYTASPELQSVPSLIYLIERAGLRPKYVTDSTERFSLKTRDLAELIDMFHTRRATDIRDKVFALLGMSKDDPGKAGLLPNYDFSWKEVFQQLVEFILGPDISVETSNESQRAVIKSKGCILGQVSSVRSDDTQCVTITSKNPAWRRKVKWTLQASAKSIEERDIVCLLQGASKPLIIRPYKDYFALIVVAATPLDESGTLGGLELSKSVTRFLRDFLLVWDWENPLTELQDQEEYEIVTKTNSRELQHSITEFGNHSDKATRIWNVALVLGDLGQYKQAGQRLQEAVEGYEIAFGDGRLYTVKSQYGLTPLSWATGNGDYEVVKKLLAKDSVDVDSQDPVYGRTPLSWAAEGGHEDVVKLLLETSQVNVESKGNNGQTPLWWAAARGHLAVVERLLQEKAEVNAEGGRRTALQAAAGGGHLAIVERLLQEKAEVNTESGGRTALQAAAGGGHLAIVELLLQKKAEVNAATRHYGGRTALQEAAGGGHLAIVERLLQRKAKVNIAGGYSEITPLQAAAGGGHLAIVERLLQEEAEINAAPGHYRGRTALQAAVEGGHLAIVKLLLQMKAEVNAAAGFSIGIAAALDAAAKSGHFAVVKCLHDAGAVG